MWPTLLFQRAFQVSDKQTHLLCDPPGWWVWWEPWEDHPAPPGMPASHPPQHFPEFLGVMETGRELEALCVLQPLTISRPVCSKGVFQSHWKELMCENSQDILKKGQLKSPQKPESRLEDSVFQTVEYTTEVQKIKQHGIGIEMGKCTRRTESRQYRN